MWVSITPIYLPHEYLLKILDILHNHTKIDLFPGLTFSQEAMKYSSIIGKTFYGFLNSTHTCTACKWVTITSSNFCELETTNNFCGIINSTHTCTACKWVTTTSFNFCELEIALESDINTGISMSKYYNFTKFCYLYAIVTNHTQTIIDYLHNHLCK